MGKQFSLLWFLWVTQRRGIYCSSVQGLSLQQGKNGKFQFNGRSLSHIFHRAGLIFASRRLIMENIHVWRGDSTVGGRNREDKVLQNLTRKNSVFSLLHWYLWNNNQNQLLPSPSGFCYSLSYYLKWHMSKLWFPGVVKAILKWAACWSVSGSQSPGLWGLHPVAPTGINLEWL